MDFWYYLGFPFGFLLKWINFLIPNYILDLIVFALIIQIIMCLVFGIRQQKNSVRQAKLRPLETIIRRKYAGRTDQATMKKQQDEIMELYQREGYNPMGGCLPMIIQLIIILPLYQVVTRPLEYVTGLSSGVCGTLASCFGYGGTAAQVSVANRLRGYDIAGTNWLVELTNLATAKELEVSGEALSEAADAVSKIDTNFLPDVTMFGTDMGIHPFDVFGQIGDGNWICWWILLIPLINLGLSYLSQFISKKLTYQPVEQQQQAGGMNMMKGMMLAMPIMSMVFTFSVPAALGVYWIVRSLLTMLQQFILAKALPYPVYTEEDLKRIEKEMRREAKNKNKKKSSQTIEGEATELPSEPSTDNGSELPPATNEGKESGINNDNDKPEENK